MGRMNWGRIFLGGVLWLVVYEVVGGTTWWLFLKDGSKAAVESLGRPFPATWGFVGFSLLGSLVAGVFTIWLYAAIRPRYGPGPMTAARVAAAFWLIVGVLPTGFWFQLLQLPRGLLAGLLAFSLLAVLLATLAGAWAYRE